jgi:hypothetical protein
VKETHIIFILYHIFEGKKHEHVRTPTREFVAWLRDDPYGLEKDGHRDACPGPKIVSLGASWPLYERLFKMKRLVTPGHCIRTTQRYGRRVRRVHGYNYKLL